MNQTKLTSHMLRATLGTVLLAAAVAIGGPAKACAMCDTYRVVNVAETDVLYMRSGPTRHARIVAAIPHDGYGVVKAGGCKRNWCLMEHFGRTGWVNMSYLQYIQ
jgi:SH3-like domain-containing protein